MLAAWSLREPREAEAETDQQIRDDRIQQPAIDALQAGRERPGEEEIIAASHR